MPCLISWLAALCSFVIVLSGSHGAETDLSVTSFSVDITPPLGEPVGLGFIPTLKTAEHPLLARGILLKDPHTSCVIATLDWMEVHNESYDYLREHIATAANVPVSHVALHCLHQHTAPAISTAAQRLLHDDDHPRRLATTAYLQKTADDIKSAIREARDNWQQVTELGCGKAQVERVASNRRIELPDGSIQGRSSSTKGSPQLRELPEGRIDPWVRSLSFANDAGPVVQLHYYASHPQTFYSDSRASYDVPGIIRQRLEEKTGVFQLYLTGCGGDIAFGKYNNGSAEAREQLAQRLQQGIETALASLQATDIRPLDWKTTSFAFSIRSDEAYSATTGRRILDSPETSATQKRQSAVALAWIQRVQSGHPVQFSRLKLGSIQLLHLPGEPFVQFQLAAQQVQPDDFICVAGYGDCGMGYIGGDRIYSDRGGYEQSYAFSGPCEEPFLEVIRRLLTK